MTRQRLTWRGRRASPPPQIPAVDRTEPPDHPAYYADPEADQYEKGDTSAWAEDPFSPMLPESPPPAMPGNLTTENLEHPATSAFEERPAKQASLKARAEKRAALCVRIASAMMPRANVVTIENKALQLMDLPDRELRAALNAVRVLEAGEDEDDEDDEDEGMTARKAGYRSRRRYAADDEEDDEEDEEDDDDEMETARKKKARRLRRRAQEEDDETAADDDEGKEGKKASRRLLRLETAVGKLARSLEIMAGEEDDEDMEAGEEDEMTSRKKASRHVEARLGRLEQGVGKLVTAMEHFFGTEDDLMEDDLMMDEDLMEDDLMMDEDLMEDDLMEDEDLMEDDLMMDEDLMEDDLMMDEDLMEDDLMMDEDVLGGDMDEDDFMAALLAEDMDGDGIDQSLNSYPQDYDVDRLSGEDDDDDEAMLEAMLDEMEVEARTAGTAEQDATDPLARGKGIQSGEGGNVDPEAAPKTPQVAGPMRSAAEEDDEEDAEMDIDITAGMDPLGLMGKNRSDASLKQLYAAEDDSDEEDEDEDEDEEVEVEVEETEEKSGRGKKAARLRLRPQPKTASRGARVLGSTLTRTAGRNDIQELEQLWESAPDVSGFFGVPSSAR